MSQVDTNSDQVRVEQVVCFNFLLMSGPAVCFFPRVYDLIDKRGNETFDWKQIKLTVDGQTILDTNVLPNQTLIDVSELVKRDFLTPKGIRLVRYPEPKVTQINNCLSLEYNK